MKAGYLHFPIHPLHICGIVLLLPHVTVLSFAPPRTISSSSRVGRPGHTTKNKSSNSDDANEVNDFDNSILYQREEQEKAQELAKQFYKELEYRQNRLSEFEWDSNGYGDDETYDVDVQNKFINESSARETGKTMRSNGGNKNKATPPTSSTRVFINRSPRMPPLSQPSPSISFPSFPFFPFPIFSSPTPAPATSAGLFSGAGTTVYSSGRSIRAEIEILESTIKKDELKSRGASGWNAIYLGTPDQIEQALKLIVGSLILLSAVYLTVEISCATAGGTLILDLSAVDGAVSSGAKEASAFVEAVLEGASSGVAAGMGKAGEVMCWLEEPTAMAGSVVDVVVRSVEELVML